VVPTTRGPERYRASDEIIAEVAARVAAGTREITLLGQTVDSYQDPLGKLPGSELRDEFGATRMGRLQRDETEFPSLLRAIAERVPALQRLRYTSPHPRHLTSALVAAHRELGVLARHVHMPVQSGSDRVLRRMARRYTVAEYRERVGALQGAVPGLTLSSDIIVGFPGETREDFELTLQLVRDIGFVSVFGFKYSPRPFTPALKLGDDISEEEKSERLARLFELSESQRAAHLARLVGSRQQVLVEGPGERGGYTGRTERNEIVHLHAARDVTGQLVEVTIAEAFKHSLRGTPTEPALQPDALAAATPAPEQRAPARHGGPRTLPLLQ
jgi:tRNA-2-methylthio-N6-dimethylallyladenosine synthase